MFTPSKADSLNYYTFPLVRLNYLYINYQGYHHHITNHELDNNAFLIDLEKKKKSEKKKKIVYVFQLS